MKRKVLALLLVTTMGCGLFSGCGSAEEGADRGISAKEEVDDGVVDLTVWADAESLPLMEELVKGFQAKYG